MKKIQHIISICLFSFIIGLFFTFWVLPMQAANFPYKSPPKPIAPLSKSEAKDFLNWFEDYQKDPEYEGPIHYMDEKVYLTDINNDGEKEFVLTFYQGSLLMFGVEIFKKKNNGYQSVKFLPNEEDNWHKRSFRDPFSKQDIFLIEACGKIVMLFGNLGTSQEPTREAYIWEKSGIRKLCTSCWIDFERETFRKLYDSKSFAAAYSMLKGYLEFCGEEIEPEKRLRIENDLAITSYHRNSPATCLEHIENIKKDKFFANAPKKLVSAVSYNESLCKKCMEKDKKTGGKLSYDYSWLLSYEGGNEHLFGFFNDHRFDSLLSAVVPNVKTPYHEGFEGLKNDLRSRFTGPDFSIDVIENRYVIVRGCIAHSCNNKGMIWVDIKEGVSGGVLLDIDSYNEKTKKDETELLVLSRSILFKELSRKTIDFIKEWAIDWNNCNILDQVQFIDRTGTIQSLANRFSATGKK